MTGLSQSACVSLLELSFPVTAVPTLIWPNSPAASVALLPSPHGKKECRGSKRMPLSPAGSDHSPASTTFCFQTVASCIASGTNKLVSAPDTLMYSGSVHESCT